MDEVAGEHKIFGFVSEPWRHHELQSRALTGGETARAARVDLVAAHLDVDRPALGVCAPIAGAVDDVAGDDAVLDCDVIDDVFVGVADVTVDDVEVIRLVDFDGFLRDSGTVKSGVLHCDMTALLAMQCVATGCDGEAVECEVIDVEEVEIAK